MTSTAANEQQPPVPPPPPPPPAEITYSGSYSVNPLAEVSFARMCAQIPKVLRRIARLSWRTDRRAVRLLLGCQVVTGVSAAVLLAATAAAMEPILSDDAVADRLRSALPALVVVALAAALAVTAASRRVMWLSAAL
ncbi:ABC transporter ATP-binding protein, partial [Streptomyces sp. NPDC003832]